MEVLTIVWFDSNCKDKDNSWNSKIKPRNLKEKFSFCLASVLFKFVCTALLLIFKCQKIVLWRTFLILLYIVDDVVSQENCSRMIIGVVTIVSRCADCSRQTCWLGSAELLSLVANSEKQYPLTQETVSSYPRNSIRYPDKLSPLIRYAISVSLFNHILLLNQPYSLAC